MSVMRSLILCYFRSWYNLSLLLCVCLSLSLARSLALSLSRSLSLSLSRPDTVTPSLASPLLMSWAVLVEGGVRSPKNATSWPKCTRCVNLVHKRSKDAPIPGRM